MKFLNILLIIILFGLGSCRDNLDEFTPIVNPPAKIINSSFVGRVNSENSTPIENVRVQIGENEFYTDANGVFSTNSLEVSSLGAKIKFTKEGFFTGYKTIIPKEGDTHQVSIIMIPDESVGIIDNNTGGIISFSKGKITFPPNSISNEDGSEYSGIINVHAKYIDPTVKEDILMMPGNLSAIDNTSQTRTLKSFGMMVVNLYDESGNKLQVASNKSVALEFDIPESLIGNAPENIPMWYFDEELGTWKEEGTASIQGNKYIGEVRHFTFWNCDYPMDAIQLEMTLLQENGNPMSNIFVKLEGTSNDWVGYDWTSNTGWVGGLVPANEEMTLSFYMQGCGFANPISIGPFSEDTDLGELTIIISDAELIEVTGILADCDGNPVNSGYIKYGAINSNCLSEYIVFIEPNGSFSFNYYSCDGQALIQLKGVDLVNLNESSNIIYDLIVSSDLGTILACNQLEEYLTYTINGDTEGIFVEVDMQSWETDEVRIYGGNGQDVLQLDFIGQSAGTYTISTGLWAPEFSMPQLFSGDIIISTFPEIGEYLEGTYEGTFTESGESITGSFKVKREN